MIMVVVLLDFHIFHRNQWGSGHRSSDYGVVNGG